MHQLILISLFIAGLQISPAQDLSTCPGHETPVVIHGVSATHRDRMLQLADYSGAEDSLRSALEDRRGEIRALAALKLAAIGKKEDLPVLLRAWSEDKDDCAHTTMELAISIFAAQIAYDPRQHPGRQPRVTPFQACVPSDHPIIALTLQQAQETYYSTAMVRVTARNLASDTTALVKSRSPGGRILNDRPEPKRRARPDFKATGGSL